VIVHGDLSPNNVLIEIGSFQPKLIDFGLSRVLSSTARKLGGTLRYMAPEVMARGAESPSSAADLFSFGRLAFFVVSRKQPLEELTSSVIKQQAELKKVPSLTWPDAPADMQNECRLLCEMCLASDPTQRLDANGARARLSEWRPCSSGTLQCTEQDGSNVSVGVDLEDLSEHSAETVLQTAVDQFRRNGIKSSSFKVSL